MSNDRCRLIIALHPGMVGDDDVRELAQCGAVYCALLHPGKGTSSEYAEFCENAVPQFLAHDVPVLIADDTQLMGRSAASGLFLEKERVNARDLMAQFGGKRICGIGAIKDRHMAMELGELDPDFIFFGKPDGDIKPEAHPKNLALAEWWSKVVEIPCVIMAGNDPASVMECAKTGTDFVCVSKAILSENVSPAQQLRDLDQLLEADAPRFEEVLA